MPSNDIVVNVLSEAYAAAHEHRFEVFSFYNSDTPNGRVGYIDLTSAERAGQYIVEVLAAHTEAM